MICHLLLLVLIVASHRRRMTADESARVSVTAQAGFATLLQHPTPCSLSAKVPLSSEQLSWPHLHTSGGTTPGMLYRSFTTCFPFLEIYVKQMEYFDIIYPSKNNVHATYQKILFDAAAFQILLRPLSSHSWPLNNITHLLSICVGPRAFCLLPLILITPE